MKEEEFSKLGFEKKDYHGLDCLSLRVLEKPPEKCGKSEDVLQGGKVFIELKFIVNKQNCEKQMSK